MMHSNIEKFTSINQVSRDLWDSVAQHDHVCLESRHLEAIELSGINNIKPVYMMASNNGMIEGIANYFIMKMDLSGFSNSISPIIRKSLKYWFPDFLEIKMLECGLISGLGETMEIRDESFGSILPLFIDEMEESAKDNDVDLILIRDIPYQKIDKYYKTLKDKQFIPFLGYPLSLIQIESDSFNDYLESLKSSTRYNLRSHLSKLDAPEIDVEIINNFGEHSELLFDLLEELVKNSEEYDHEKLSPAFFELIDKCLAERSFIICIKRYGKIIAFGLCLEGDKEVLALDCGVNQQFNAQYQLYFNLCLLTIKAALNRGKKSINFGITNYNYKLIFGCELQPLVYFVKHYKNPELSSASAKIFAEGIKQPENPHRPFSNQDISKRHQLKEIEKDLENLCKDNPYDVFQKANSYTRMDILRMAKLYSFFPGFESAQQMTVQYNNRNVIMLGSNSYLGLASHPEVREAAKRAIDKYGTGCSGSPVLNGTLDIHLDLAKSLASFMQKEDAIIFSTGYQTNLGVVAAIAGRHDLLILDNLNHASIMDGAKFSYANVARYEHNDMNSLEEILQQNPERNKFVVADTVFSMEGTIANIPEIIRLAKKYDARVMLDEAHGIGVLGPGGRGAAEHFGLLDEVDIVMGTFSKSFAGVGGFVASDAKVIDYLRHVARPHLFSASLPPPVVASVRKALDIIINEPQRRIKVLNNAQFMANGLRNLGYHVKFSGTAIASILCGDELLTLALFTKLFQEGIYVNPVLSPAVPKGQELLRTSYMAIHEEDTLRAALRIFEKVRTPDFPLRRADSVNARHDLWDKDQEPTLHAI